MKKLAVILLVLYGQNAFAQQNTLKNSVQLDSIATYFNTKIDSITSTGKNELDSLAQQYHLLYGKTFKLIANYQQQMDSLKRLNLTTEGFAGKIDSLTSIITNAHLQTESNLNLSKLKSIEKLNSLPVPIELQQRINKITRSLNEFTFPLPTEFKSPFGIGSLNPEFNGVTSIVDFTSVKDLPLTDGLTDITKNIQSVTSQTGAIQQDVGSQVNKVSQYSQLDKLADSQLSQVKEVGVIKDFAASPVTTGIPTENEVKEQILDKAKDLAVNHFAGKEEELKAAMASISKLKRKYSSLNSLSEILKGRPNEMRGKPLIERVVPGIGIQLVRRGKEVITDINPYIGYRLTGKFTSGLGWNQRLEANFNNSVYVRKEGVYGPRLFSEFMFGQGFVPRAEFEMMNVFIPVKATSGYQEVQNRQWVFGMFVGIKREYRFVKNTKGTALLMFRVFNHKGNSPYNDVISMRFGFEFPMKKKVKSVN